MVSASKPVKVEEEKLVKAENVELPEVESIHESDEDIELTESDKADESVKVEVIFEKDVIEEELESTLDTTMDDQSIDVVINESAPIVKAEPTKEEDNSGQSTPKPALIEDTKPVESVLIEDTKPAETNEAELVKETEPVKDEEPVKADETEPVNEPEVEDVPDLVISDTKPLTTASENIVNEELAAGALYRTTFLMLFFLIFFQAFFELIFINS